MVICTSFGLRVQTCANIGECMFSNKSCMSTCLIKTKTRYLQFQATHGNKIFPKAKINLYNNMTILTEPAWGRNVTISSGWTFGALTMSSAKALKNRTPTSIAKRWCKERPQRKKMLQQDPLSPKTWAYTRNWMKLIQICFFTENWKNMKKTVHMKQKHWLIHFFAKKKDRSHEKKGAHSSDQFDICSDHKFHKFIFWSGSN